MKPQALEVLALLRARGSDGVSDDDARQAIRCTRLAARVYELRADGFDIERRTERHRGGTHARYVIREAAQLRLFR